MNADEITRLLDELGKRLGPAGEHVFELAVRQQVIVSTMWLIGASLVALICLTILVSAIVYVVRHDDTADGPFNAGAIALFLLIPTIVVAVLNIPTLLNPEYAAMVAILNTLPH